MKSAYIFYASGSLALIILWLIEYLLTHFLGGHWALVKSLIPLIHEPLTLQICVAGACGLLMLIPIGGSHFLTKSFYTSLILALPLLLIIYPFYKHIGFGGVQLHILTPFVTIFYCWIWSAITLFASRIS